MDDDSKNNMDGPKFEVREVIFIDEVDDVSAPKDVSSSFNSIHEWLYSICDSEKPKTAIAAYNFGVFESPGEYIVFLTGTNKYVDGNHSKTRIEFEPSDMYFKLPFNEHKDLDRHEVYYSISSQLKDFINSEKFNSSFFAEAKSITIDFEGEVWSK